MRRLVDPVHMFNEVGAPVLTIGYLEQRIRELEVENDALRRQRDSLARKLRFLNSETDEDENKDMAK